jgi:hypothetical protein
VQFVKKPLPLCAFFKNLYVKPLRPLRLRKKLSNVKSLNVKSSTRGHETKPKTYNFLKETTPHTIPYCAAKYVTIIKKGAYSKGELNLFIANKLSEATKAIAPKRMKNREDGFQLK